MPVRKYVTPDAKVFDIGCGSGILAIAAAKLGANDVTAVDLDEVAVEVAKENVKESNVEDKVTVLHGNLTDVIHDKADVVVANIIADIIKIGQGCTAVYERRCCIYIFRYNTCKNR